MAMNTSMEESLFQGNEYIVMINETRHFLAA
jgi:hypothetical protein